MGVVNLSYSKKQKKPVEYHKKLLTFIIINSVLMMWCSYILAWYGKAQIAEALSTTVATTIVGVTIPYLITKVIENVNKYGSRLNKTALEQNIKDEIKGEQK